MTIEPNAFENYVVENEDGVRYNALFTFKGSSLGYWLRTPKFHNSHSEQDVLNLVKFVSDSDDMWIPSMYEMFKADFPDNKITRSYLYAAAQYTLGVYCSVISESPRFESVPDDLKWIGIFDQEHAPKVNKDSVMFCDWYIANPIHNVTE